MRTPSFGSPSIGLFGVAIFALTACGGEEEIDIHNYPDRAAEAICKKALSCECTELNELESQADCELAAKPLYEAERDAALAVGATFDADCALENFGKWDAASCDDPLPQTQCRVCKVFQGAKLWGEPCAVDEECDEGLRCFEFDGNNELRCGDPCENTQPNLEEADVCYEDAQCSNDDLWCDLRLTNSCQTLPLIGEECPWNRCEAAGFCNGATGICDADVGAGEPCSYFGQCGELHCTSDDVANPGTCEPLPSRGDPCGPRGECSEGDMCEDGTCVRENRLVCGELQRVG